MRLIALSVCLILIGRCHADDAKAKARAAWAWSVSQQPPDAPQTEPVQKTTETVCWKCAGKGKAWLSYSCDEDQLTWGVCPYCNGTGIIKAQAAPKKNVPQVVAAPTPAPAPTAKKSCPCSPACTCGCNEGKPCSCGNASQPTPQTPYQSIEGYGYPAKAEPITPFDQVPIKTPGVRPDRLPPVQFQNWYPGQSYPRYSRGGSC